MSSERTPLNALILAGGYATRLHPLTLDFPKALLTIGEQAIVEQILNQILEQHALGIIKNISLLSNHHYVGAFRAWLNAKAHEEIITLMDNGSTSPDNRLGAIGDIYFYLQKTGLEQDLLVVSSDTLSSLNLGAFISFYREHNGAINAVFDTNDQEIIRNKLGNLEISQEGIIVRFLEKPEQPISTLTSVPYYLFGKQTLPLIWEYAQTHQHDQTALDSPGKILEWLITKTEVWAFNLGDGGYYFDVGTKEMLEYLRARSNTA